MNRRLVLPGLTVIVVVLLAVIAYAFVLPLFTNRTANEPAPAAQTEKTVAPGENSTLNKPPTDAPAPITNRGGVFIGLGEKKAGGNVTLLDKTIRLEQNFTVQNAPDLRVYLGTVDKPVTEIAPLKANNGGQNYELPANIKPESISYVWIHCKQFNESYAMAKIN